MSDSPSYVLPIIIFETTADIPAPADRVWDVITDLAHLSDWDSGVVSVSGTLAIGEKLKLVGEADPERTFSLKVTALDAPHTMVWSGGMPFGLFRGERTYALEEVSGGTRFTMREEFSGAMLPLIRRSLPDLQPSFDQFANGLRAEVERRNQGARR